MLRPVQCPWLLHSAHMDLDACPIKQICLRSPQCPPGFWLLRLPAAGLPGAHGPPCAAPIAAGRGGGRRGRGRQGRHRGAQGHAAGKEQGCQEGGSRTVMPLMFWASRIGRGKFRALDSLLSGRQGRVAGGRQGAQSGLDSLMLGARRPSPVSHRMRRNVVASSRGLCNPPLRRRLHPLARRPSSAVRWRRWRRARRRRGGRRCAAAPWWAPPFARCCSKRRPRYGLAY